MSTSTPTPPPANAGRSGGTGNTGRPSGTGNSNRFFGWIRSLGIVRADGWISGVCGGIAIRTGIDPLIVRGIAIVIAVLGGPAFLLYAAAWLLLPDTNDQIYLEKLIRGTFEPVVIAIGAVLLLSFLPVAQGFWWTGGVFAHNLWWVPVGLFKLLWNLAIVALIVWFVFWVVRRMRGGRGVWVGRDGASGSAAAGVAYAATATSSAAGATAPAEETVAGEAVGSAGDERGGEPGAGGLADGGKGADEASTPTTALPENGPAAPTAPGKDASADELARWREQHEAWRAQQDAWRLQLRADQRLQREQRSAAIRAQSQAMAAQAEAARAERRVRNPRTSGWYIALTLGVALLAGGIAAAIANGSGLTAFAAPIGFAAALTAVGFAMFVAGFLRRRAGFLAAIAIVLAVLTYGSFALPNGTVDGTGSIGYAHLYAGVDHSYTQLAGRINVEADFDETDGTSTGVTHIKQGAGSIAVTIGSGLRAVVNVTSHDSHVSAYNSQGNVFDRRLGASGSETPGTISYTTPGDGPITYVIDIEQGNGEVSIFDDTSDAPAAAQN